MNTLESKIYMALVLFTCLLVALDIRDRYTGLLMIIGITLIMIMQILNRILTEISKKEEERREE